MPRKGWAQDAGKPENGFRAGDRWSVVGDSITHTGTYHAWVHLFYLTRFPGQDLEVLNGGIAGDTAAGGLRRFGWDIGPQRGTVATVDFGMNDVGRGLYAPATPTAEQLAARKTAIATLLENQRKLVAKLQDAGLRVILLSPSIFDDEAELPSPKLSGVNAALGEAAEGLRQLAQETRSGFIDLHGPMLALNRELQKKNPAFTLTGPDRIHPGVEGHFVMAYFFLKAQGAPVEVSVSRLTLDSATLRATQVANGKLENLRRLDAGRAGIAFEWTEAALPFPLDAAFARAAEWVPFTRELNQETLQVTQLPPGNYQLRIDGAVIREVTAAELATGLNLAVETATPQYRQAQEVLALVKRYSHQAAETLRNVALVEHQTTPPERLPARREVVQPYVDAKFTSFKTNVPSANLLRIYHLYATEKPREADSRAAIAELQAQARRAAQPKTHAYEIVAR